MTGIVVDNVLIVSLTQGYYSSAAKPSVGKELRGTVGDPYVLVNYTVRYDYTILGYSDPKKAYQDLSTQLVTFVEAGNFTYYLRTYSTQLGVTALQNASSSVVATSPTTVIIVNKYPTYKPTEASASSSTSVLSAAAITGIAVSLALLMVLCGVGSYYCLYVRKQERAARRWNELFSRNHLDRAKDLKKNSVGGNTMDYIYGAEKRGGNTTASEDRIGGEVTGVTEKSQKVKAKLNMKAEAFELKYLGSGKTSRGAERASESSYHGRYSERSSEASASDRDSGIDNSTADYDIIYGPEKTQGTFPVSSSEKAARVTSSQQQDSAPDKHQSARLEPAKTPSKRWSVVLAEKLGYLKPSAEKPVNVTEESLDHNDLEGVNPSLSALPVRKQSVNVPSSPSTAPPASAQAIQFSNPLRANKASLPSPSAPPMRGMTSHATASAETESANKSNLASRFMSPNPLLLKKAKPNAKKSDAEGRDDGL